MEEFHLLPLRNRRKIQVFFLRLIFLKCLWCTRVNMPEWRILGWCALNSVSPFCHKLLRHIGIYLNRRARFWTRLTDDPFGLCSPAPYWVCCGVRGHVITQGGRWSVALTWNQPQASCLSPCLLFMPLTFSPLLCGCRLSYLVVDCVCLRQAPLAFGIAQLFGISSKTGSNKRG